MRPSLSVVVTTHNHQNFISETLRSLETQSLDKRKWETIIVDDCSKDYTPELLERLRPDNSKLVFLENSPGNAAYTKNRGLRVASADCLMMLDGDDIYEPITLEATLDFMNKNPEVLYSYSMHKRVDEKGKFISIRKGYPFSRERILHYNFVGAVECFRKGLFEEIGGFREYDDSGKIIYPEDYDFVLRASEVVEDNQIKRNPITLYRYRRHQQNKSNNLEASRDSAGRIIEESLRRKEGLIKKVNYMGKTPEQYSFYDWREND